MTKILLIDDDEKLGELLATFFERFDMDLVAATHPDEGLRQLEAAKPDLVILDVMLPGQDGFEVCRTIRRSSNIPIIMLTARGEVTDRIVGLEIGADDYLPKPFEPRELTIDLERRTAELAGESLELTTMEYQLLVLFVENPGRTFTRDEILNELRGIDAQLFSRSVDILVSRLRQKLQDTTKQPRYIKTVWGTGYIFIGQEDA